MEIRLIKNFVTCKESSTLAMSAISSIGHFLIFYESNEQLNALGFFLHKEPYCLHGLLLLNQYFFYIRIDAKPTLVAFSPQFSLSFIFSVQYQRVKNRIGTQLLRLLLRSFLNIDSTELSARVRIARFFNLGTQNIELPSLYSNQISSSL